MDQVSITLGLANALVAHLRSGGTRLEADMLAERLIEQANAPATEAQRMAEIEAAVAARVAVGASQTPPADPTR